MTYAATVHIGETNPELAREKALGIYDFLGPEFFESCPYRSPLNIVLWLERLLLNEDLQVDFNDPNDAMLFKLKWA